MPDVVRMYVTVESIVTIGSGMFGSLSPSAGCHVTAVAPFPFSLNTVP